MPIKRSRRAACWVGGVPRIAPPEEMVSRAYLKMAEALEWSAIPLARGEVCVELGCSPGGAAQALLERGLFVIGIDPAEVDPTGRRASELPARSPPQYRGPQEGFRPGPLAGSRHERAAELHARCRGRRGTKQNRLRSAG